MKGQREFGPLFQSMEDITILNLHSRFAIMLAVLTEKNILVPDNSELMYHFQFLHDKE